MSVRMAIIPDSLARCMSKEDRKACGLCSPEERHAAGVARRERTLQGQCETWLRRNGIEYLHLSPHAREKAGWPDLVFAFQSPFGCQDGTTAKPGRKRWGVPWAIELKVPGGRLTDAQMRRLEALERNGWRCAVCWSYEEFLATIAKSQDLSCGRRKCDNRN